MLKCENLPRTNSTKYETQNILVKFQQNEHTPAQIVIVTVFIREKCPTVKQKIHIISFQLIRRRSPANSFHDLSMNSVSMVVIGEFWRATKKELVRIA